MARAHAGLYRRTGGRWGRRWFAGAPVMVLQTTGRRSGRIRSTPVLYLRDGDRFVVMAANAGADRTPAWWLNLQSAGTGEVTLGRRRITITPREVTGEEKIRLLRAFIHMYPQAECYQDFTDRDIPLISLEPVIVTSCPPR
jgi:deazaflavin-dependent oxidoreductase (nitroreductase family)